MPNAQALVHRHPPPAPARQAQSKSLFQTIPPWEDIHHRVEADWRTARPRLVAGDRVRGRDRDRDRAQRRQERQELAAKQPLLGRRLPRKALLDVLALLFLDLQAHQICGRRTHQLWKSGRTPERAGAVVKGHAAGPSLPSLTSPPANRE